MKTKKTKTTLVKRLIREFSELRDALREGKPVEQRFTVRTVAISLLPRSSSAGEVRTLRLSLGVSQAIFARLLGVSVDLVSAWEQGTRKTSGPVNRIFELMLEDKAAGFKCLRAQNRERRDERLDRRAGETSERCTGKQTAPAFSDFGSPCDRAQTSCYNLKMPGLRDRNLRSGDLHEELGILLLKLIALVAPVPRQEDVGNDAFATLIRCEGSRRLIPDLSFLVQLKAASIKFVSYSTPEEVTWITNLEVPLFIGRVQLEEAKIELYSTIRLHQILLEQQYDRIDLMLDPEDETSALPNARRTNIGPPVHTWSLKEGNESGFLTRSYAILRPHIESLHDNRRLRGIQIQKMLNWKTSEPPVDNGEMMHLSGSSDIAPTLRDMVPHARRLMMELQQRNRYGDFFTIIGLFDLMRRWGVDPDPSGCMKIFAGSTAQGSEISVEDAIQIRSAFQPPQFLDLRGLRVTDETLLIIPESIPGLVLTNCPISDYGVGNFQRLKNLKRLNLAGTNITDVGLLRLCEITNLEWMCVNRTKVTREAIDQLKRMRPAMTVLIGSEP